MPSALSGNGTSAASLSGNQTPVVQPVFDNRITTLAFPMTGHGSGTIERGFMVWDKPIPGYSGKAAVHYMYNPSTVSADYTMSDPSVQASMNFPIASDTAQLAIPLSQTVNWTTMYDRTYEVNSGIFHNNGTVTNNHQYHFNDPRVIGVQADVVQMMQFTGMLTNYSYGTALAVAKTAAATPNTNFQLNQGIMQLIPSYAYFGNAGLANNVAYYGFLTEWSVQYTDWTQYNVPYRCVISLNMQMLPPPQTTTTAGMPASLNLAAAGSSISGIVNNQLWNLGSGGPPGSGSSPSTSGTGGR